MKYKGFTITVFIIASSMNVVLYVYIGNYEIMNEICNYISFIAGIPALICIGKMYLDHTNEMYSYCSGLSYYFYIVHLPVVVLCQYFISLTGIGCIYNIYKALVLFDKLYAQMNEAEKREFLSQLVDNVQIYEERKENGQWLKSIEFKLPIIEKEFTLSLDNDTQNETVCLLSRKVGEIKGF